MPVPQIVLDGTMAYGSRAITINGETYIANNIQVTRPVSEADDMTVTGAPNRKRATHGRSTLTAELQLAASSTVYPKFGDTWNMTVDSNYGSEQWCLMPTGYEEDNGDTSIRVVNVNAFKVINGITTVGVNVG